MTADLRDIFKLSSGVDFYRGEFSGPSTSVQGPYPASASDGGSDDDASLGTTDRSSSTGGGSGSDNVFLGNTWELGGSLFNTSWTRQDYLRHLHLRSPPAFPLNDQMPNRMTEMMDRSVGFPQSPYRRGPHHSLTPQSHYHLPHDLLPISDTPPSTPTQLRAQILGGINTTNAANNAQFGFSHHSNTSSPTSLTSSGSGSPYTTSTAMRAFSIPTSAPVYPYPSSSLYGHSPQNFSMDYFAQEETIRKLRHNLSDARNNATARLNHCCQTAMLHINDRDAEIERLRSILKDANIIDPGPAKTRDPAEEHYEQEFKMLFKSISQWAKQFYKFPTGEDHSQALVNTMLEVCEDARMLDTLTGDKDTKYMVVAATAIKFLVSKIFAPAFLGSVAAEVTGGVSVDFAAILERPTDEVLNEKIYNSSQSISENLAKQFIHITGSLMSRPHDATHRENTLKHFTQICQHGARITQETCKRRGRLCFLWSKPGDCFQPGIMKKVTYDTLGLDMVENPSQVALAEIRGSLVHACIIPTVMLAKDGGGESAGDYMIVYKAAVMLV